MAVGIFAIFGCLVLYPCKVGGLPCKVGGLDFSSYSIILSTSSRVASRTTYLRTVNIRLLYTVP